jgi:DNA-binding GntR family transcriptional regulator
MAQEIAGSLAAQPTVAARAPNGVDPLFAQAPQFRPLRNDAYEALREAILLGRLRPGERVVEAEIARQMGISRGPIREAVRQLEQEHMVEYHPRRGVVVVQLTREAVQDTYVVRAELDGFAARLSALRITDEQLGQLDDLIAAMRRQATEGDSARLLHTDVEFHRRICTIAGNRVLSRTWSSLGPYAWTLFSGIQLQGYSLGDLAERHLPIADALHGRDPARAEWTAKEHTLEIARNVLDHLDHNPLDFLGGGERVLPDW